MHPSAERLYAAAKSLKIEGQSAVARWLNEAPQTLNNWEKRGVSKRGAVEAQKRSGYSAAWILEGTGEPLAFRGAAAAPGKAPPGYEQLSPEEQCVIDALRTMGDEDEKRKLLKELCNKTARRRSRR